MSKPPKRDEDLLESGSDTESESEEEEDTVSSISITLETFHRHITDHIILLDDE